MADEQGIDANPQSTWGAPPEYIEAWNAKYGKPSLTSLSKAELIEKAGLDEEAAKGLTKADLVEQLESGG